MRPKTALDKLKPLLYAPYFTSKDAYRLGVSSATLAWYVKQNELIRIGHGVYRSACAPTVNDFRWEDLVEAVQRINEAVICLTTALQLYHLTDEMPSQYWLAIRHGTSHRATPLIKIVRMRDLTLGRTTIHIADIELPIFDRERTIVDAFRYLGRETALKALKIALAKGGKEKIDVNKIQQYAKKLRINIAPFLIAMTV